MAEIIRMPRMSDTMEEGNIVGWQKEAGEEVEAGETLAEIETDKATMDFDSPIDGVLLHIEVDEGPVPIGGVIAVIGDPDEDWKGQLASAKEETDSNNNGESSSESKDQSPGGPDGRPDEDRETKPASSDDRQKASPLARAMAKQSGVDLSKVKGTGDQGRIVKRDIQAFLETPDKATEAESTPTQAAPAPPQKEKKEKEQPAVQPFVFGGGEEHFDEVRVSQMRKVIARRLGESKYNAPHFYLTVEINMDKVVKMRTRVNEVAPTKISFNDFIIKAASTALRSHPYVNASWNGDTIRLNKDVHIGVAVAIDEGLLVPVVRYADMKTLSQINAEVRAYAAKAKDRKLQPDEMSGNTFSISNLGMFGIEEFTAIINPPDSCILAVGAIVSKPIVKEGAVVPASMMKVTLSCDHRVVDGATGAKFLQTFKEILEDPVRLLV